MTEHSEALVISEKKKMMKVAQEIVSLVNNPQKDHVLIRQKILEFLCHLSNIGGFCDGNSQQQIHRITEYLASTIMQDEPVADLWYKLLCGVCVRAIGIQVDFTKKPFRVMGLDIKALGAQFKALFER